MPDHHPETTVRADVAEMGTLDDAIHSRKSVRRFLPTPVPRETLEALLNSAGRSPSGVNTQPWRVIAVGGPTKKTLSEALVDAHLNHASDHQSEMQSSPERLPEPYKTRQRQVGWALYGLLGIEKGDRERTLAQHARNFRFFDAPVGLIFTIDKALKIGSWLDYGMFLQTLMLAARGRGLHTCPQVAFAKYHRIIREHLPISDHETVVCGMSLGYEDPEAPENTLITPREPVDAFATFLDLG